MVSNSEVAKKFAEGKEKATGSHMYIDGDTIYSYGHHFPMAKRWNKDGIDYLYNPDHYSPSTACHQAHVRSAIWNSVRLEITDCDISKAQKQKENNLAQIDEHKDKLTRVRVPHSKEYHENQIKHYEEQNKLLEKYIAQTE